jgi:hypothetical protein
VRSSKWRNCVGAGWQEKLVDPLLEALEPHEDIEVADIKEKFGTLRIYMGDAPEWAHHLADALEHASETMCEYCGRRHGHSYAQDGYKVTVVTRDTMAWVKTRCNFCRAKDTDANRT